VPLVNEGYARKRLYAISPGGDRFVYYDWDTKGIVGLDIETGLGRTLIPNIASSGPYIREILFIGDNEYAEAGSCR